MKWFKVVQKSLLILSAVVLMAGQTVFAADTEDLGYTYTVRLSAGNQGKLTGAGVDIPEGASMSVDDGQVVVSGVAYGKAVYIYPQEAVVVTDERYYIRGVRRSGRDNAEAVAATGLVASDLDYVIAYGIKGEMVKYTVSYQDAEGNQLLPDDTYYGNEGERQYVSARYVDGYQPQAYNLVKTLSVNEAENVFIFQYTPVVNADAEEQGTGTSGTAGTAGATGTGAGGTAGTTGTGTGGTAGTTGTGAAGADTGAGTDANADEGTDDADARVGGDAVAVPDDDVPQAGTPDELQDLDDEEVPLANMADERPGTMVSYLPVYIGIGAAAVLALIVTAFYLKKRRRIPAEEVIEKILHDEEK